jgi:hypothetical protein
MGTWAVTPVDEKMDVSEIDQSPTPPFSIDLSSEEPTILEPATLEVTIDSHWGVIDDGTLDLETGPAIQVLGTSQRAVSVDKGETVEEEFELLVQESGEHRVVARLVASEDVRRLPVDGDGYYVVDETGAAAFHAGNDNCATVI